MTHEAIQILSEYIRINTTNPPGNESEAVRFLENILTKEGIPCKTYEAQPGRVSLRAVIRGTGEKPPLILLNHMDVVPADASEWSFDPFGGEIRDGFICGRGTLDMKGLGIMQLMTFLALHRQKVEPDRDVIFLAVADEEVGGAQGAEYLLENHPEDFPAGLVLNEGGFGVSGILPTKGLHMISTAEKGPCWLKLTRTGPPGHGSVPHGQNALEELVKALHRVVTTPRPITITPVVGEYFRALACEWDFLGPFVEDGNPATLERILRETGIIAMPQLAAMMQNTISLNVLQGGDRGNVIPSRAEAILDIRLLPGQEPGEFTEWIQGLLEDDAITVEPVTVFYANESPLDHPDYQTIADTLQRCFPDTVVAPSLTTGTTDSRFFREKGFRAYGVFPIMVPMDDLKTIHGIDEKISEENMIQGTEVYTDLVFSLCKAG
ncbi:MAG: M20/M25/M40 family metallo-hydrolase [Desulfatibacillum sp.]|nr:M20/M25/M40 family metallo-hydrolase [Desulfatibacillum sp.]